MCRVIAIGARPGATPPIPQEPSLQASTCSPSGGLAKGGGPPAIPHECLPPQPAVARPPCGQPGRCLGRGRRLALLLLRGRQRKPTPRLPPLQCGGQSPRYAGQRIAPPSAAQPRQHHALLTQTPAQQPLATPNAGRGAQHAPRRPARRRTRLRTPAQPPPRLYLPRPPLAPRGELGRHAPTRFRPSPPAHTTPGHSRGHAGGCHLTRTRN